MGKIIANIRGLQDFVIFQHNESGLNIEVPRLGDLRPIYVSAEDHVDGKPIELFVNSEGVSGQEETSAELQIGETWHVSGLSFINDVTIVHEKEA